MTAEEIRATPAITHEVLPGGSTLDYSSQIIFLREIAAQLAEHNERERRAAERTEQFWKSLAPITPSLMKFMESRLGISSADSPAPPGTKPGDVIEPEGGRLAEVCNCGLAHAPEEAQEELRIKLAQQRRERKPS